MIFNYSKLRGRIIEIFGTQSEFAKAMNWSETDILKALSLLKLSECDIHDYFFIIKVQNIEHKKDVV